jgi:hypothetical protein
MIARLIAWLRGRWPKREGERRPLTSTERARNRRARLKETHEKLCNAAPLHATLRNVASVAPPHREESKILENKKTQAHTIPENWQPDDDGHRLGVQAFGADGIEAAIARHRDTWLSRPERLNAGQWEAKWRAWCRLHIAPSLPLGPQLASRKRETPGVTIKRFSPQAEAWEKYRGKSFPWGRHGVWTVPTEWPPGMDEAGAQERRESG